MDIEVKFKLIEILYLSPDELSYLDRFTISDDLAKELLNDNIDALKSYFEKLQNNQNLDDSFRLFVACLKRRITPLTIAWTEKEDLEDDGEEDYDYYGEKLSEEDKEFFKEREKQSNELWKEREKKFHKSLSKLKQYTQNKMNSFMFDYIWEKFPQLQKGFDRKIYNSAKDSFFQDIGIYWYRYQLPDDINKKINIAIDYVQQEIINRFRKLEEENVDKWTIEYKQWMQQRGLAKYTKASIKAYFDFKELKVSALIIDVIKNRL